MDRISKTYGIVASIRTTDSGSRVVSIDFGIKQTEGLMIGAPALLDIFLDTKIPTPEQGQPIALSVVQNLKGQLLTDKEGKPILDKDKKQRFATSDSLFAIGLA